MVPACFYLRYPGSNLTFDFFFFQKDMPKIGYLRGSNVMNNIFII